MFCLARSYGLRCVLFLLAAMPSPVAMAAENGHDFTNGVRDCMQQFVEQGQLAGAVAVVGQHDGILCYETVGVRDLDTGQPMTEDTLFRIASMTKPVTAIGLMMLVDEGRLSVDDEVEKHLPEFRGQMLVADRTKDALILKKPSRNITIRDLLTHTSGLPGLHLMPGLADLYAKRDRTLAEVVMAISQRPLEFEPGSRWAYCNTGIDTVGRIIEVVAGQSYENFLQKRIFEPLGMTDTTFYPSWQQRQRTATIYGLKEGKLVALSDQPICPGENVRYPLPAGGLYSTGADLAKLYQMMLCRGGYQGKRLLSEESVQAMTSLQTRELEAGFVPGMGFGLGWGVVREPSGVTEMLSPGTFGHGGAFATQGWLDAKQNLFVILLIQRVGLEPNGDASEIRRSVQHAAVALLKDSK